MSSKHQSKPRAGAISNPDLQLWAHEVDKGICAT